MKTGAKFIVLHHKLAGGGGGGVPTSAYHRAWLVVFVLFFIFTFAFTLFNTRDSASAAGASSGDNAKSKSQLPKQIYDALLHYASVNASQVRLSSEELKSVAAVIRRCAAPCNILAFGITHETHLWNSLNLKGRTVFVAFNPYIVSDLEVKHPSIEAYDVEVTTKVSELYDLLEYYKGEVGNECRPVQNLLFSDCKLAINDLPNHIYDVPWDVILINAPGGNDESSPGRMAPIFTAGVLARSKRGGAPETHIFVHDFDREVERVCSEEFLCRQNFVETVDTLGHFVIRKSPDNSSRFGFCPVSAASSVPQKSI